MALAVVFTATLGWSLIDGYQYHYLLCQLLILFALVDWSSPKPWAFRLLRFHVAIVYVWTAITKLDPVWLDGTLASIELAGPAPCLAAGVALIANVPDQTVWSAVAIATVVLELGLSVALFVPRTWKVMLQLGLTFHVSFLLLGFKIGLFPLYMVGLLLFLMLHEAWFAAVAARVPSGPSVQHRALWPVALAGALGIAVLPVPARLWRQRS